MLLYHVTLYVFYVPALFTSGSSCHFNCIKYQEILAWEFLNILAHTCYGRPWLKVGEKLPYSCKLIYF